MRGTAGEAVAWMERSEIQGQQSQLKRRSPDCATLHPGYEDVPFIISRSSVFSTLP